MDRSSIFSSSLSSCTHPFLPHISDSSTYCSVCGLFVPSDRSNIPLKSHIYDYSLNLDRKLMIKSLFEKILMKEINLKPNHPYSKVFLFYFVYKNPYRITEISLKIYLLYFSFFWRQSPYVFFCFLPK